MMLMFLVLCVVVFGLFAFVLSLVANIAFVSGYPFWITTTVFSNAFITWNKNVDIKFSVHYALLE